MTVAAVQQAPILVSPHAPSWGGQLISLINRIVQFVQRIFSWFWPAKPVEPTSPPQEFLEALERARKAEEAAKSEPIGSLVQSLIQARIFTYGLEYFGWVDPPFYYWQAGIMTGNFIAKKIFNTAFPHLSPETRFLIDRIVFPPLISYAVSQYFGRPYNWK